MKCTSFNKDVKDFKDVGVIQLKQVDMYFPEYKDVKDFKDVDFGQYNQVNNNSLNIRILRISRMLL